MRFRIEDDFDFFRGFGNRAVLFDLVSFERNGNDLPRGKSFADLMISAGNDGADANLWQPPMPTFGASPPQPPLRLRVAPLESWPFVTSFS